MASVAVIFGGLSGFLSTLFALIALDAGWRLASGLSSGRRSPYA